MQRKRMSRLRATALPAGHCCNNINYSSDVELIYSIPLISSNMEKYSQIYLHWFYRSLYRFYWIWWVHYFLFPGQTWELHSLSLTFPFLNHFVKEKVNSFKNSIGLKKKKSHSKGGNIFLEFTSGDWKSGLLSVVPKSTPPPTIILFLCGS